MKKLTIFVSLLAILSIAILGATSCGEEGPSEPVVLRVAMDRPPGSFDTVLLEEWAANFNERAAGSNYSMVVYPASELCTMEESLDMVRTGAVDMAFFDLQYSSSRDARFGAMGLPFVLDDPEALSAFSEIIKDSLYNDIMEEEFNQRLLAFQGQDFHTYCGTASIHTLADWDGLIIQTASPLETACVEALGGSPIAMPFMDVVPSLEKGVIEGAVGWNAAAIFLLNCYDAVGYITVAPVSGIFATVSINRDVFEAMPGDIQDIMLDEAEQFEANIFAAFQDLMVTSYAECESAGIEIYQLPASELETWRQATASVIDDFYAQLDSGDAETIQDAFDEANQ
ncbi:MAG: TRAP transporter substrate-binding protein DctP [Dehalococcoidia bacterium]